MGLGCCGVCPLAAVSGDGESLPSFLCFFRPFLGRHDWWRRDFPCGRPGLNSSFWCLPCPQRGLRGGGLRLRSYSVLPRVTYGRMVSSVSAGMCHRLWDAATVRCRLVILGWPRHKWDAISFVLGCGLLGLPARTTKSINQLYFIYLLCLCSQIFHELAIVGYASFLGGEMCFGPETPSTYASRSLS